MSLVTEVVGCGFFLVFLIVLQAVEKSDEIPKLG